MWTIVVLAMGGTFTLVKVVSSSGLLSNEIGSNLPIKVIILALLIVLGMSYYASSAMGLRNRIWFPQQ
nr:AIF_HP1_G0030710.mRNA.1.CDS.1 [Saccharomyces cerevisiae]